MKITYLTYIFILTAFFSMAQESQIEALRTSIAPKIDGFLDDEIWTRAKSTKKFTQFDPNQNVEDEYETKVKVAYDDNAIYFSAFLQDEIPDSIPSQVAYRDGIGANADYICFFVDTYNDDQNGFGFCLSVANTQSEAKYSIAEGENWNWNTVWMSKTKIVEDGWQAEVKILFPQFVSVKRKSKIGALTFGGKKDAKEHEAVGRLLIQTITILFNNGEL